MYKFTNRALCAEKENAFSWRVDELKSRAAYYGRVWVALNKVCLSLDRLLTCSDDSLYDKLVSLRTSAANLLVHVSGRRSFCLLLAADLKKREG